MNVLLDLGNSRCKFAVLGGSVPEVYGALPYSESKRLVVVESVLRQYSGPDRILVCSVLGHNLREQLVQLFMSHQVEDCFFLDCSSADSFGIRLGYRNPGELGADRLAAMIAANAKYHGDTCIVDCGTAVTVDALGTGGIHHGGVIFPGLMSMRTALAADTSIDFDEETDSFEVAPGSTRGAIYTGCLSAVAGGIERVVRTMQDRYGSFDQVILTGGDAKLLEPLLTCKTVHEPYLVLDGLKHVSKAA